MKKLITGRTHYYAPAANIVMAVTISGLPLEEELRTAVKKALQAHEVFSSKVILDTNGDSFYESVLRNNINLTVREMAGFQDLKLLVREQERTPFDFTNGELIRFFLLKEEKETKLVIVMSHLAGDGMSVIYLIRDIMTALGYPEHKVEKQPFRLMMDFGYPKDSGLNLMMRLVLWRVNRIWRKEKKIFSYQEYLDMFHTYWKDRELGCVEEIISGVDFNNLVKRCKKHHVSINSAISAAFLMAAGAEEVGMAVNVRPEGYEGMGNFASGISIEYIPKKSFEYWENVSELHQLIHKRLNKNDEKYFVLQFLKGLEPTLIDASYFSSVTSYYSKTAEKIREWFGYQEKQQITIGISNLLKPMIPSKYGNYGIEKIEFLPPLLPNNRTVLGVVTVEDKMTITMQYEKQDGIDLYAKVFENAIRMLKTE